MPDSEGTVEIQLAPLESINPSLAEAMRICPLLAGLSKEKRLSPFVLGNPKGWLGNAYHGVLDRLARGPNPAEPVEETVTTFWNEAVAQQHARILQHPLNRRYGNPASWPGYNLVLSSLRRRAPKVLGTRRAGESCSSAGRGGSPYLCEEDLKSFGGRLVGRPDIICDGEIRDYKTGEILEDREESGDPMVKDSYRRQLQIYAFLMKENFGEWPTRLVLEPMTGGCLEVPVDAESCTQAASESVELLDSYNRQIALAGAGKLATPSPDSCRWCQFKILCASFWDASSPEWSEMLDGSAIECLVLDNPAWIFGGKAVSIPMEIQRGSESPRRIDLAPLPIAIHPHAAEMEKGTAVRVTGLRMRADGSLVPGIRTVISALDGLPVLA